MVADGGKRVATATSYLTSNPEVLQAVSMEQYTKVW